MADIVPNRAPLAGEQVASNTRNVGGAITTVVMLLGIAHEYGLTVPDKYQPILKFATDPRIVVVGTSAALWASNMWRKSRLHRILDHQLDKLEQ